MKEWAEIKDIKPDTKNDMLLNAFIYAVKNNVDTVELEAEFNNGQKVVANITFKIPKEEEK
jgi:hypothetical protein